MYENEGLNEKPLQVRLSISNQTQFKVPWLHVRAWMSYQKLSTLREQLSDVTF